ncbi:MAG TPA: relaxase/mobilization nuclease domain-containing protein [Paludibacteraceae bacterium]|nr:relaxase/mobilization nuclease domain-containing protein [Paludibacteraceae bacterium]
MAITKIHPIKSTLKQALAYVLDGKKTDEGILVSSFACSPETADLEFGFTLSHCMEKGNNLAFHLIQSFKPGETNQETAHKIGADLAHEVLKGKYEYVLSTHIDKGHIHNHLIFCAANFIDYRKYISNRKSYYQIRKISDRLCEEFGLSVVVPQADRGNSYKEYLAKKEGVSWKNRIRKSIEIAVSGSLSYEEFCIKMNMLGMEIREGRDLAFRIIGKNRYVKASSLGYKYWETSIKERIFMNFGEHTMSISDSRSKWRSTARFNNLKLTANSLNYLLDNGIETISMFNQKLEEERVKLAKIKTELRNVEKTLEFQLGVVKQLKITEKNYQQTTALNNQYTPTKRLLFEAATQYLQARGLNPPYPSSKIIFEECTKLRGQLDDLYESYNELKRHLKRLQIVQKDISRVFRSDNDLVNDKRH